MYNHVLITGGAGFVGSSLALDLRRRFPSIRVTAFDNLYRRGSEVNLPRLAEAGVGFVHGDVRSPEDLRALAAPPDLLIECSAEPSAQAGYGGSPEMLIRTNLDGCFHCLEYARTVKSDFLFLSTSRVYPVAALNALEWREEESRFALSSQQNTPGASAEGVSESFPLDGARSLYGMTKLAGELMVTEYGDAYGLRTSIVRCGLIAGPWQMGKSDQGVVTLWVAAHHFRRPLRYIGFGGGGKQVRDILHVDDLCDLVADHVSRFECYSGRMFNAGGGLRHSASLLELTRACEEATGNRIEMGSDAQNRPADVRLYLTDHRRLTAASGWKPSRGVKVVIGDIAAWIRANEASIRPLLGK
jgi:CDP-paratose 2-epimerase